MPLLRGLAALTAAAAVTGASGCGGGAGQPLDPAVGGGTTIEDQLGFDQAGMLARQGVVENGIRACMKAQGFDYVAVDPVAARAALIGSRKMSDAEFRRLFGYGISTLYGRAMRQTDPNARLRMSLSGADRAAYDRALTGGNPEATFAQAVDTGDFTQLGGCTKQATEASFGGAVVLTTLQAKLDELDERILADQRMVRAVEAWSTCMRTAGYPFTEPDQTDVFIARRLRAIVGPPPKPGATPHPRSYDHAALAELQRFEVELGNADQTCEERHIEPVERLVRGEEEAAFRRDNSALLASVRPAGR